MAMKSGFAATREQIRELDKIAVQQYGIDGLILMENAGRWCARTAARMLGGASGKSVAVVCGPGNNGGDGFVIARHLSNWGADVRVVLLARVEDAPGGSHEAAANLHILLNMGIAVSEALSAEEAARTIRACAGADLLVDALLGTGTRGEIREPFYSAINAINECACQVLAVDVPSGLDCNTGAPLGTAVRAVRTVTFVANKVGFVQPPAREYTGEIEVAEISIPRAAIEKVLSGVPGVPPSNP
jgi:NAD(P)H-hydrate epimerase